jgi:cell fate (sporulation/competence/biofilm development) regulator YmcA (YheA/YmcA/DUF963 family)
VDAVVLGHARMNPEHIAEQLADAVAELDEISGWFDHPADIAAVSRIAAALAELKLDLERENLRADRQVPA